MPFPRFDVARLAASCASLLALVASPACGAIDGSGAALGGRDGAGGTSSSGGGAGSDAAGGGGGGFDDADAGTEGGCVVAIDGIGAASMYGAPATGGGGYAELMRTGLELFCDVVVAKVAYSIHLSVPAPVTAPGSYTTVSASLNEVDAHVVRATFIDGACTVDVDELAAIARGGLRARFTCPSLTSARDGAVAIRGAITLPGPGPFAEGAGAPSDAGATSAPSCAMTVRGGYTVTASGEGDNSGCTVTVAGVTYTVLPFAGPWAELQIYGRGWCSACFVDYSSGREDGGCTSEVALDEGIGGRYVARFACQDLRTGDGTSISVEGWVDGPHRAPPR